MADKDEHTIRICHPSGQKEETGPTNYKMEFTGNITDTGSLNATEAVRLSDGTGIVKTVCRNEGGDWWKGTGEITVTHVGTDLMKSSDGEHSDINAQVVNDVNERSVIESVRLSYLESHTFTFSGPRYNSPSFDIINVEAPDSICVGGKGEVFIDVVNNGDLEGEVTIEGPGFSKLQRIRPELSNTVKAVIDGQDLIDGAVITAIDESTGEIADQVKATSERIRSTINYGEPDYPDLAVPGDTIEGSFEIINTSECVAEVDVEAPNLSETISIDPRGSVEVGHSFEMPPKPREEFEIKATVQSTLSTSTMLNSITAQRSMFLDTSKGELSIHGEPGSNVNYVVGLVGTDVSTEDLESEDRVTDRGRTVIGRGTLGAVDREPGIDIDTVTFESVREAIFDFGTTVSFVQNGVLKGEGETYKYSPIGPSTLRGVDAEPDVVSGVIPDNQQDITGRLMSGMSILNNRGLR